MSACPAGASGVILNPTYTRSSDFPPQARRREQGKMPNIGSGDNRPIASAQFRGLRYKDQVGIQ
jgi:hypothetical protein